MKPGSKTPGVKTPSIRRPARTADDYKPGKGVGKPRLPK